MTIHLLGYTAIIAAFEIRFWITGRTILNLFIAVVPTIVLAITEQPFGNATVIGLARTTLPTLGAVALATHVRRLIGIITTIVVKVTHP